MNRRFGKVLALSSVFCVISGQVFACSGDVSGFWEKRPVGSQERYGIIEEFKINSDTRILSLCGRNEIFASDYSLSAKIMKFGYRHRLRELSESSAGTWLSDSWISEHSGVSSEYRLRVKK